jgi:hypothetical protein
MSEPSTRHAEEITDPELQSRIRARYQREFAALEALGFRQQVSCLEVLGPYSALTDFLLLLLMFSHREVLAFPRPLRLAVGVALLSHASPSSVAICMGLGVKFYTDFSDRSLLISPTFESHAIPGPNSPIFKNPPCPDLAEAWAGHQRRAAELQALGKTIHKFGSFADYVEIFNREEDLSQYI